MTKPLLTQLTLTLLTGFSLLLSACASSRIDYQRDMQHYIGRSTTELTHGLGKAEQQYEQDGTTILVFRPISYPVPMPIPATYVSGSSGISMPLSRANSMSYNPDQRMYANCRVAFSIKDHIVQSWTAKGRECPKSMLQR